MYGDILQIANSQSLRARVAACAATEGIPNPDGWASQNAWKVAAQPGWGTLWEYHRVNSTINHNPDLGARTDVITDEAILAAVQAIRTAETSNE